MDILAIAKAERDRLNKVIAILEPEARTASPTPAKSKGKPRGRHQWTEAERKAMSIKQKALWAKKKKVQKAA